MKKSILGGLAAASPAQATTDSGSGPYGSGYMGDHDAYAYWNMFDQMGNGVTPTIAQNFAAQVCARQ
jgi:hypothetical protein